MTPAAPWVSRLEQHILMARRWGQAPTLEELDALPKAVVYDPRDWCEHWRLLDRYWVTGGNGRGRVYGGLYRHNGPRERHGLLL